MAFNHTASYGLSVEDERYLSQQPCPLSRPMELFSTTKVSDPLPGNWSYDSAIELFSLNPADMDPVSFDFGDMTADSMNSSRKLPAEDTISLSSDADSDEQSWSMSTRPSIDMARTSPTSTAPSTCASANSFTNNNTKTATSTSTSSTHLPDSPEIKREEYIPIRTDRRHKRRSLITESSTSSTQAQAQAQGSASIQVSAPQEHQGRNATKRAAHNIIEKRYRTNMNAKFLALEKAICPASVQKSSPGRAGTDVGSLKKSEILSIALTYIEHIQQENLAVQKELVLLKQGLVSGGMWKALKPGCP